MRRLKRSECAVLPLVVKGKWYEMIERGEKREEYRLLTDYWMKRIFNWNGYIPKRKGTPVVEFRLGYARNAKRMAFLGESPVIVALPRHREWGEPKGVHFVIGLGERVVLEG